METKLFVGNLSYNTTAETLQSLFSQAGTVTSVELIKDRETGNSKGFAFIMMGSQSEMEKAISTFNGYMLDNREVKVNIAKPREERPRGEWYSNNSSNNNRYSDRNSDQKRRNSKSRY